MILHEVLYYLAATWGLVLFWYYYVNRHRFDFEMKAIEPYMWLTALAGIYEVVVTKWLFVDSTAWFRIFSLLEVSTLLYFFNRIVSGFRPFFWISLLVYMSAFTYMLIKFEEFDIQDADQVLVLITTLIVYVYGIGWFRQKFMHPKDESLLQSGTFYIISGLLIYFSATIFLFLSAKLIYHNHKELYMQYWTFNIFMVSLTRLIFTIGVWKARI